MKTTITKTITLDGEEVTKILRDFIVNSGLLAGNVEISVKPTLYGDAIERLIATSSLEQEDKTL
jgi:hypothetical protein